MSMTCSSRASFQLNKYISFKAGGHDPRLFRKEVYSGAGLEVVILVDVSGSMRSMIDDVANVSVMIYKAALLIKGLEVWFKEQVKDKE